jgi:hypothetical protein
VPRNQTIPGLLAQGPGCVREKEWKEMEKRKSLQEEGRLSLKAIGILSPLLRSIEDLYARMESLEEGWESLIRSLSDLLGKERIIPPDLRNRERSRIRSLLREAGADPGGADFYDESTSPSSGWRAPE